MAKKNKKHTTQNTNVEQPVTPIQEKQPVEQPKKEEQPSKILLPEFTKLADQIIKSIEDNKEETVKLYTDLNSRIQDIIKDNDDKKQVDQLTAISNNYNKMISLIQSKDVVDVAAITKVQGDIKTQLTTLIPKQEEKENKEKKDIFQELVDIIGKGDENTIDIIMNSQKAIDAVLKSNKLKDKNNIKILQSLQKQIEAQKTVKSTGNKEEDAKQIETFKKVFIKDIKKVKIEELKENIKKGEKKGESVKSIVDRLSNDIKAILESEVLNNKNTSKKFSTVDKNIDNFEITINKIISILNNIPVLLKESGKSIDDKAMKSISALFEPFKVISEVFNENGILKMIDIKSVLTFKVKSFLLNQIMKGLIIDIGEIIFLVKQSKINTSSKILVTFSKTIKAYTDIYSGFVKSTENYSIIGILMDMLLLKAINKFIKFTIDEYIVLNKYITTSANYLKPIDTKKIPINNIVTIYDDFLSKTKDMSLIGVLKSYLIVEAVVSFTKHLVNQYIKLGEYISSNMDSIDNNSLKQLDSSILSISTMFSDLIKMKAVEILIGDSSQIDQLFSTIDLCITGIFISILSIQEYMESITVTSKEIKNIENLLKIVVGVVIDNIKNFLIINILGNVLIKGVDKLSTIIDKLVNIINTIIIDKAADKKVKQLDRIVNLLVGTISTLGILSIMLILGAPIILVGLFILVGVTKLLIWSLNILNSIDGDKTKKSVWNLLVLSLSLALFTVTLLLISQVILQPTIFYGMLALVGLITIAVTTMWILSLKPVSKSIYWGALSLLVISGAFVLFTITLTILSQIVVDGNIILGMVGLAALVGLSVLIMKFVGNPGTIMNILLGCLGLVMISTTLLISSIMLVGIAAIFTNISWEGLLKGVGAIAVLTAICIGVGLLMSAGGIILLTVFSASMVLLSIALFTISGAAALVAALDLGDNLINNMTLLGKSIDVFIDNLPGIGKITLAMLKVPQILALSLAIASIGGAIGMIANLKMVTGYDSKGKATGYKQLTEKDFTTAAINVSKVITVMLLGIEGEGGLLNAYTEIDTKAPGALSGTGKWGLGKSKLGKVISLSTKLGKIISSVAIGVSTMANLKVAEEWNRDGKPTKYRQMKYSDFELAADSTKKVVTCLLDGILSIADRKDIDDLIKGGGFMGTGKSRAKKVVDLAVSVGKIISSIAIGVKEVGDGKFKNAEGNIETLDYEDAANKVKLVITTVIRSLASLAKESDIADLIDSGLFKGKSDASKVIQVATGVTDIIGGVASSIAQFANNEFKGADGKIVKNLNTDAAKANITKIITAIIGGLSISDEELKKVKEVSKQLEKAKLDSVLNMIIEPIKVITPELATNYDQIVGSTGALIKHVSSVDVSKMKELRSLIEDIDKLSESIKDNFKDLAEDMEDTLKSVSRDLNKVANKFETMNKSTIRVQNTTTTNTNSNDSTPTTNTANESVLDQIKQVLNDINNSIDDIVNDGMKIKGPVEIEEI